MGHAHDSGLERKTCFDLNVLKVAGQIKEFRPHPVVDLIGPSGGKVGTYCVDFIIENTDGSTEFLECKGEHLIRDGLWRLKWALLQDRFKGNPLYKFRVVTQ